MSTRVPHAERPGAPLAALLVAQVSVQTGAAFAKRLFGEVAPTSLTWLRLVWAAAILLVAHLVMHGVAHRRRSASGRTAAGPTRPPSTSPPSTSRTPIGIPRSGWLPALGYTAGLLLMNWGIYQAFQYIPLGVGVTVEFLGPLALAVAGSRRASHLVWAGLALAGVVLLEWTPAPLDHRGLGYALLAAVGWAVYIVCGSRLGPAWPGTRALTLACTIGAIALAVPAVHTSGSALLRPGVLFTGLAIGLLSSVIPYALELFAMRRIAQRVFGVLMSLEPVAAALAALVVLHERLGGIEIVAMACIVMASIGATRQG